MTVPRLKWALLGASWIAESRVIAALRGTGQTVTTVLSSDASRAGEYARRNGIPSWGSYSDGLPEDLQADAVYISATNDRHRELAEASAARGLHVLCEKPLADSTEDSEAIVKACEAAGVILAVNHHLVAAGSNALIRELVASGAIGPVRAIRVSHARLLPEQLRGWRLNGSAGSGVIPDVGTHDASVINALLHPAQPREVYCLGVSQGGWGAQSDDAAMSIVRYDGDVLVQTHDGFTTPDAFFGIEVLGAEGSILGRNVLAQDPIGSIHLNDVNGTREIEVTDREDLYAKVIRAFATAIQGDGRPTVTGEEGLRATLLASAMEHSSRMRMPVQLNDWRFQ